MKKALISLAIILGLGIISHQFITSNKYHIVTVGGECEDNCIENGFFAYANDSKGNRFYIELSGGEGSAIINSKCIVQNTNRYKREVKNIIYLSK